MGGYGSTRWEGRSRRRCIGEGTRCVSLRDLRVPLWQATSRAARTGRGAVVVDLAPDAGVVVTGALDVSGDQDSGFTARFVGRATSPWGDGWVGQAWSAMTQPQPRGGVRWWLQCPSCAERCTALYWLPRSSFACRRCHGLRYATQRMMPAPRLERRAHRLRERAGANAQELRTRTFPATKPRRRWWKRFEALQAAHDDVLEHLDIIRLTPLLAWLRRRPPFAGALCE